MEDVIKKAITDHLVIANPQSIHYSVDKIMKLVESMWKDEDLYNAYQQGVCDELDSIAIHKSSYDEWLAKYKKEKQS